VMTRVAYASCWCCSRADLAARSACWLSRSIPDLPLIQAPPSPPPSPAVRVDTPVIKTSQGNAMVSMDSALPLIARGDTSWYLPDAPDTSRPVVQNHDERRMIRDSIWSAGADPSPRRCADGLPLSPGDQPACLLERLAFRLRVSCVGAGVVERPD
jgi:hypothetical protein